MSPRRRILTALGRLVVFGGTGLLLALLLLLLAGD